jgi:hypothetical protein
MDDMNTQPTKHALQRSDMHEVLGRGRTARCWYQRHALPALGLALLSVAPVTFAADAQRFLGSWQVDVSKLPVPDPPASVTITWADAGSGKLKMSVDIVDRRGMKSHAEATVALDGSPSRAVGSLDVDVVSVTVPSDRVLIMGAGMAGNPSNTRVFTISDDGRRMSETIISHGAGNIPATRVNAWAKQ